VDKYTYLRVGQFQKPIGTEGEIKASVDEHFKADFMSTPHLFVMIRGNYVPYFIEYINESHPLIVKMEEIDDPSAGASFTLKDIYLRKTDIRSSKGKHRVTSGDLSGFTIIADGKKIGIITAIEIFPQQIMATVDTGKLSILIPLVEAFVVSIDDEKRTIYMELPEGLLQL